MTVKELIMLLEELNENLIVKAPNDETHLGEVSGVYFRGSFYELVVEDK